MIKIFIVDDHAIIRQSLRDLLQRESDLTVCGEAASAETALTQIPDSMPDLALIDVSLPKTNGIDLARILSQQHPHLRLVILSGHGERSHVEQARRAGVHGYILKGEARELAAAIRKIAHGEQFFSAGLGYIP